MSSSKKRTFAPRESDRGSSIKSEDQPQTLYSFRNGTVNAISLAEFSDFKEKEMQRIEATKKPKGFHSIRISDSLAYKKANPQTKLWYYDKNQYKNAQEIDQEHYSEEEEEEELEEEVPVKKASVIKAQQQVPEIETPPEDPKYLPTLPELMLKKKDENDKSEDFDDKKTPSKKKISHEIVKKEIILTSGRKLKLRI